MPRYLFLLTLIVLSLVLVPSIIAQDTVTDDEVNDVAKEVYCPVCENTPLDVCETQACADWRELIRTKLADGQSKEDIFAYFAAQYGDRVLASPPKEGFNLILWIWPVFALLAGAILFGRYLRDLRGVADQTVSTTEMPAPADGTLEAAEDDYVARIEKELAGE